MKILFFGDVVGRPGREAVRKVLPELKTKYQPDLTMANAENVAHGKGVTVHTLNALIEAGVDVFTSGNHVFDKEAEAREVFAQYSDRIIRPANFSDQLPGKGYAVTQVNNQPVLIINLNGQTFMEKQFDFGEIANPFEKLNQILQDTKEQASIKILDFHAEATSEKRGMGFWCDGRLSAVLGTHTHVATADAQILPGGTGYLTDIGMVGVKDSVIGVATDSAVKRFLTKPGSEAKTALEIAEGDNFEIGYVVLEIDEATGKCLNIDSHLDFVS